MGNRLEVRLRDLPHQAELELVIHLAASPSPDRVDGTAAAGRHYFAGELGFPPVSFAPFSVPSGLSTSVTRRPPE